ncbi:MAG: cytochrome b5 [Nitrospirae bacterium]|nr:cytochrome b5 [Nitrospirota bacterium]
METEELGHNDGKDGRPAYVAYNGKIYDVSDSRLWKNGVHMARHKAGADLTDFLTMAPHGEEIFSRVKEVASLEVKPAQPDLKEQYREFYRKFHPHPIVIHFPIALFFFGAFMQFIFLMTRDLSFEKTAFYPFAFATLTVFSSVASGVFSWWINYDLTLTTIFKNKLYGSIAVIFISCAATLLHIFVPGVEGSSTAALLYNILVFGNVPLVFFIAYNGGKITWPS